MTLDEVSLAFSDNGIEFFSDHYFSGIGNEDTANFSVPWNISSCGAHNIVASHMGAQTDFDGVKACDAGYATVVMAYVNSYMFVTK